MNNKAKLALAVIVAAAASLATNAQLCVKPGGRVQVGNYMFEDTTIINTPVDRRDTISSLKLFGYNYNGAGARMTFGDQPTRWTYNVAIGELSRHNDTDRLWLQGKVGLYFTAHSTIDTICYYDTSKDASFHFNTDVIADGILLGSDSRFKHDVNPVENGLDALEQLKAVSYKLNPHFTQETADKFYAEHGYSYNLSGKLENDREYFRQFYAELANQPARYGFIAQQVEEVLPELVHTDKAGYKYVDYIGVIPLLVNAVQELQAELAEVKGTAVQKSPARAPQQTSGTDGITDDLTAPALHQNIPNPFTADTHIRYCLPESVQQADLYIYDMQGHQIKKIAVTDRGESAVTIHGSELQAGMYIYALIADGQEVDSKRMILTK